MAPPAVEVHFTRPQARVMHAIRAFTEINLEWGRGTGKSWFMRWLGWHLVSRYGSLTRRELLRAWGLTLTAEQQRLCPLETRGIRIVWLMPTLRQFKAVHGGHYKVECESTYKYLRPRPNWGDYRIDFGNGSIIQPFPADPHHIQRARGIRADVVLDDERDDIDPSIRDAVMQPWFSEPWSLKIGIGGGTPKRGRHGLLYRQRQFGLDATQPRYRTFFATHKDTPEIVDAKVVADAKRNVQRAIYAREWDCDYDSAEGLVYPFDEAFHVREPPPSFGFHEYWIGADHGWTDPGVLLLIGVHGHGKDAIAWVLDEVYQPERVETFWVEQARTFSESSAGRDDKWKRVALARNPMMACDRSRPDRIRAFQAAGLNAVAAENDIRQGVDRVADLVVKRPTEDENNPEYARLYVRPCCTSTIREFARYRRKKDRLDTEGLQFTQQIVDRDNHAMDALRYFAITRFGPLESGRSETPR